ncbi:hypothetical protein N7539_003773 [Penicillium diatomitis]|uniref:Uncharacterized protein n=1 Tax=Penicillium diatomitis TaxID=2819901 RepID=A0A9W9XD76_9EURO|nr:uncharacterized protein N7539_003773 [Penicillium diatomitis]KAJ5488883.1 hypothetical protein N7539_003773 [Penicillium diatomitis]
MGLQDADSWVLHLHLGLANSIRTTVNLVLACGTSLDWHRRRSTPPRPPSVGTGTPKSDRVFSPHGIPSLGQANHELGDWQRDMLAPSSLIDSILVTLGTAQKKADAAMQEMREIMHIETPCGRGIATTNRKLLDGSI